MSWTTQGGYSCSINPDPTWFYYLPYPNVVPFSICDMITQLDMTLDDADFEGGDTGDYKTVRVEYDYTYAASSSRTWTGTLNFFIQPSQTSSELVKIASAPVHSALTYPPNAYAFVIDYAQIIKNNGQPIGQINFNSYNSYYWNGGWAPQSYGRLWNAVDISNNNFGSDPGPHYFEITLVHTEDVTTTTTTLVPPTTTTTTTSIIPTTTTTTLIPTTTTTTTPLSPIRAIETVFMEKTADGYIERIISDASESEDTKNTPFAKAFNFGTIAPRETSKILPVFLRVPNTKAIRNIQLGLTNTGGIVFTSNVFGITTSKELRDDIVPYVYFQGVNTDSTATNTNNISISNTSEITTDYVYLGVNLPTNNFLGEGVVRYRWFFDYYN